MSKYHPPKRGSRSFNCPFCHVYSYQQWYAIALYDPIQEQFNKTVYIPEELSQKITDVNISFCLNCKEALYWLAEDIIYPVQSLFPPANRDLPENVKRVYEEAATIANLSQRAACALLRYALEVLLEDVGKTGNLNTNIGKLVEGGLDQQIQQALDIVRVSGNHAVHPKEIDFNDTTDVHTLFELINVIADTFITQRKRIQKMFDNLPENDKKAIEKRDGKTQ